MSKKALICFITAIYGNYDETCKPFVEQSIPTDFICFTDNASIANNGWMIDTTPYHTMNRSILDDDRYTNSFVNNQHTFNIAKYYKQSFPNIPRLAEYDVIVWVDGSIEIIYDKTSEYIMNKIDEYKIIGWHHEYRYGSLRDEVIASNFYRYTSTHWFGQNQPYQDVNKQFEAYLADGFDEEYFRRLCPDKPMFGVWLTCFVAFLQKDEKVKEFLDMWYLQTLKYTTQDQISFPYVCQKTGLLPYTLPNEEVSGDWPHIHTMFYNKHQHNHM